MTKTSKRDDSQVGWTHLAVILKVEIWKMKIADVLPH